jgi:outer membrane protein
MAVEWRNLVEPRRPGLLIFLSIALLSIGQSPASELPMPPDTPGTVKADGTPALRSAPQTKDGSDQMTAAGNSKSRPAEADSRKGSEALSASKHTFPSTTDENAAQQIKSLTIRQSIEIARDNYPKILKARIQVSANRDALTLQKVNEYMPEALFQYQEIMASRNKLTQIIYGSPVFPGNPGPGLNVVSMRPIFFSGCGFNLDWQPLDFGLHKAKIELRKAALVQSIQDERVTVLDTELSAALNFLDAVMSKEQARAARANLQSFEQIKSSVDSQVRNKLRPATDSFLADAELARARNILVRARLAEQVSLSSLANAMGLAGSNIDILPGGLSVYVERDQAKFAEPDLDSTPLMAAGRAAISAHESQRRVIDRQIYPTFHWLFGTQLRGSGLNIHAQDQSRNVHGLAPCIPNYQMAMIVNWNFLDFARLHQEKKIQDRRIQQSRLDLHLLRNNLVTEDLQTRAQLQASYEIVENTRIQLKAAEMALKQAETRYNNGLSSIVALAESSQAMEQARLEEVQAHIGIWKVLLTMAALRGDLKPFLDLTQKFERRP